MTTAKNRRIGLVAMAASLLSSCLPCAPIWGPGYPDMGNGSAACGDCGKKVEKNTEFTVKDLAGEIDSLEKHIEKYGSIVPKQADIWGEARLMLHRQEFEQQMSIDLSNFHESFQAWVYRSDQAYAASALSLQAAVSTRRRGSAQTMQSTVNNPPAPNLLINPNDMISNPDTVKNIISRSQLQTQATSFSPPTFGTSPGNNTLSLEPTLREDQKARYLYHLNELRRTNEGDDNSDAPGYTLNLVRIPISVLTGSCTQTGWGAECTVTATPHLSDDLLPQTFRTWVINDLIDSLTLPITKMIESNITSIDNKLLHDVIQECSQSSSKPPSCQLPPVTASAIALPKTPKTPPPPAGNRMQLMMRIGPKLQASISQHIPPIQTGRADQYPVPSTQLVDVIEAYRLVIIAKGASSVVQDHPAGQSRPYHLDVRAFLQEELSAAYELLASEKYAMLWLQCCTPILVEAVHSHDVCTLEMLSNNFRQLVEIQPVDCKDDKTKEYYQEYVRRAVKPALAWTIIVEAALLNDRLMKDMRITQSSKGCLVVPEGWLPLYVPHPSVEMSRLFLDYVRCRWPLYVFALDPETDDQNIMDQYDLRREMQLALALSFTSGQIGAGSMSRYIRRIEEDMDTIAINRTIVGFAHGPETFGWRFYPRVQTPPIPGNLTVIFRDMLWGARGPRFDLRYRRLENGVREVDALVVMPAIVPYVDLEFTSNWFALANPKCKQLNLKDAMRLSQRVQAIRESSSIACDMQSYRPGDPALLMRRLEQLSLRLPLQHQLVNVPFENTHGGYEMLATGVSNLAPRLSGWYGAPGIDPNNTTNLFLVGNNFSVTQTRVIVGGQVLTPLALQPPLPSPYPQPPASTPLNPPQVELLSRQVVRVSIPTGAFHDSKGSIDVHIATPYGISAPLSVPMVGSADSGSVSGYAVDANNATLQINYQWDPAQPQTAILNPNNPTSGQVRITWDDKLGSSIKKAHMKFYFKINNQSVSIELERDLSANNGVFEIGDDTATAFAQQLLDKLNATNLFGPQQNKLLPASLDSSKIEITPISPPYPPVRLSAYHDVKTKEAANSIHIDFLLRP